MNKTKMYIPTNMSFRPSHKYIWTNDYMIVEYKTINGIYRQVFDIESNNVFVRDYYSQLEDEES